MSAIGGRALDRGLVAALSLWALGAVLPLGAWLGATELAYYARAWDLWWRTVLLAALAAALALFASRGAAAGLVRRLMRGAAGLSCRRFLLACGVLAGLEAAAVSAWCFARNPQTIDAWVQYFQARVFLSGALTAPPPPSVPHFATLHMLIDGQRWTTQYPPIHPALLAAGMALGAAWLVTPLLTALFPLVVYLLGRRTADERIARLAAVLGLLSPFLVAMGASAMNHVPAALCVGAGLSVLPDVARGRWGAGLVLGTLTGLLVGLRPLDGAVLAALGGVALLAAIGRRAGWTTALATAAGGLLALLPTLAFNAATTGDPLRFGYLALHGAGHGLGFHAGPWGQAHTPLRALGATALDAHQLNVYLLEWPVPVTALIAGALWGRGGRLDAGLRASAGYLVALVAALFFYFHRDTLYGPRLLFSALPAVFVLLAAALVRLTEGRRTIGWRGLTTGDLALVGFAAVAVVAAVDLAPRRLASYSTIGTALALHPERAAADAGLRRAVVVIPDGWGTRLIVRMWGAGVPMAAAGRIYRAVDACTLEERLAAAEAEGVRGEALAARLARELPRAAPGRPAPNLTRDPLLRLPADGRLTPRCVAEIEHDQRGTLQYAPYAYLNAPALDGDVIWARELGPGDAGLQRHFPDRDLYRYAPSAPAGEAPFQRLAAADGGSTAARTARQP